jgi:hypothetical protein
MGEETNMSAWWIDPAKEKKIKIHRNLDTKH